MSTSPERRLAYFALDVPHKGQASHIHISEIIDNLRRLGWQIDLYAPEPAELGPRAVDAGARAGISPRHGAHHSAASPL